MRHDSLERYDSPRAVREFFFSSFDVNYGGLPASLKRVALEIVRLEELAGSEIGFAGKGGSPMPEQGCGLFAEILINENPLTCSPKKIAVTEAHFKECEKCRARFAQIGNLGEWQAQWGKLNEDPTKGWGVVIALATLLFAGAWLAWYFFG